MKYTINEFRAQYPNDDVCLDKIFQLRYTIMPCCPRCSQQTTFKRITGRRCYQCSDKDCQYQLYPTAGTVFEKTRTSLSSMFYIIYLMTSTRNGVAAKEIERQLGVTYKCAWRLGHRIRQLMKLGDQMLSGIVEVDETWIGGAGKNKHKIQRQRFNYNAKGLKSPNKIGVFAMLERNGVVVSKVIEEATGAVIRPILASNIVEGTKVVTDSHNAYNGLKLYFNHTVVDHKNDEFVKGSKHTNTIEGCFSHLKRMLGGTHIKVSRKHLQKYADEHCFRYTYRHHGQQMFNLIINRIAIAA